MTCTLCKAFLPIMVVFPTSLQQQLQQPQQQQEGQLQCDYQWFGLSPNVEEEMDSIRPDRHCDPSLRLVYVHCEEHFREHDYLKSIHCPCLLSSKGGFQNHNGQWECGQRFPTVAKLVQHLGSAHGGQTLCELCLTHRPLFLGEQQLFRNKAALQRHSQGLVRFWLRVRNCLCLFLLLNHSLLIVCFSLY
jgi:hypothetical protein